MVSAFELNEPDLDRRVSPSSECDVRGGCCAFWTVSRVVSGDDDGPTPGDNDDCYSDVSTNHDPNHNIRARPRTTVGGQILSSCRLSFEVDINATDRIHAGLDSSQSEPRPSQDGYKGN